MLKMLPLCVFQHVGLLLASFLNALLSTACCVGLLMAIGVTVSHNGQGLMRGCNDTVVPANARSPVSAQCPFDTTRIYVSLNSFFSFFFKWTMMRRMDSLYRRPGLGKIWHLDHIFTHSIL